jgi:hypothetical protein
MIKKIKVASILNSSQKLDMSAFNPNITTHLTNPMSTTNYATAIPTSIPKKKKFQVKDTLNLETNHQNLNQTMNILNYNT